MAKNVDAHFTKALPKVELHAHLTGSINADCLYKIWTRRREQQITGSELADPRTALRPDGAYHDIMTFFSLFDTYIYNLCNSVEAVSFATDEVLKDFEDDGVRYLELRTTPREATASGMTKDMYIETVLTAIERHGCEKMSTHLILSIDRRNTLAQALEVVSLAIKYKGRGVVGVDLCGNPLKGHVAIFREAFGLARAHGLKITLHFAETAESGTEEELDTLLSYAPDRIGHVIHVPPTIEAKIKNCNVGLELCLSCNVHAKMLPKRGSFADHHFGMWLSENNPIALCTDDVGVFGSPVSNEYLLAAQPFNLSRRDLVDLSSRAIPMIFGTESEKERLIRLLVEFTKDGM